MSLRVTNLSSLVPYMSSIVSNDVTKCAYAMSQIVPKYVINHLINNNMKKFLVQSLETTKVDKETGEILRSTKSTSVIRQDVEPFFFTYSKQILALYGKNVFNVTTKVLYKLLEFADNNTGKVYMNSDRVQEILDICKISKRSYYRAIEELKEDGIISGDKSTFTIAENMFWKGDRKTREKLMKARLKVTFDPIYDEDDKTITVMQDNGDNSLMLTR